MLTAACCTAGKSQPTTHNPQPTTHNPQPTTHNPQPTTHNPQPTTHNSQLTTPNPQPATHHTQTLTPSQVKAATVRGDGVTLIAEPVKGGADISIDADVVLVAIGRRPRTEDMELEKFGVKLDERKRIVVGEHLQTSVKGVYAIGDCITGPMLAHKAEEEGIAVAEHLAGKHGHVNYDVIPGVVYTHPEVASVGKTEEELKAAGVAYKKGVFPFLANSRARSNGDSDGMVKFLTDAKTDKVLGCHMIGSNAGEAIAEACLAMEYGASCEDIARTCHAHPTLSEAVKEAAMAAYDKPIHM